MDWRSWRRNAKNSPHRVTLALWWLHLRQSAKLLARKLHRQKRYQMLFHLFNNIMLNKSCRFLNCWKELPVCLLGRQRSPHNRFPGTKSPNRNKTAWKWQPARSLQVTCKFQVWWCLIDHFTEEPVTAPVPNGPPGENDSSREPLLYTSSSSNPATGSTQTPDEEFKLLNKLPGVIPLSGHNNTGWL